MAKLYVSPEEEQEISRILRQRIPRIPVLAFGSRVQGNYRPFSDLDLALEPSVSLSLGKMAELRADFSDSNLPYFVDLVDLTTVEPAFKNLILKQTIRLV